MKYVIDTSVDIKTYVQEQDAGQAVRLRNEYRGKRCQDPFLSLTPFLSSDGFFDGSKGGWRFVSYRRSGTLQVIDDEATLQKFYRPGLMGMLLKGQKLTQ
jgi:hypothetical protein